jgi:hypothetical protein
MLHPALGDDPTKYEHEEIKGIGAALKRKADGSCHYLADNGCTIWPNTPALCQAFDCRAYVAMAWASLDPLANRDVIAAGMARSIFHADAL